MKKLLFVFITCASFASFSQQTTTLEVVVKNFSHNEGRIRASLYPTEADWLKKPYQQADTIIYSTEEVMLYFADVPQGTYAVSVHHDENGNKEFDTNAMGIPSEDYGFSNNARGMFGPAKFQDAAFQVDEPQEVLEINLN